MKKKVVVALLTIALVSAFATGCGDKKTTEAPTKDAAEVVEETEKAEEDQEPAAVEPEGEETTGDSIFLDENGNLSTQHASVTVKEITQTEDDINKLADDKHYKSYEDVIANLGKGMEFTYVELKGVYHPVLIVSDVIYDNGEGKLATIRAGVYGYDNNNEIVQYAVLASDGTASPLAVSKDGIFQVGKNSIEKYTIDEKNGAWVCLGAAEEEGDLLDSLVEEYKAADVIDFGYGK